MFVFSDYNTRDLLWLGDWSPRWVLLLLLLGLAALAFSAFDLRDLKAYRRWTLVGLRAVVYGLAVLLLLEPALDLRQTSKVKNHIAVLVDISQTMGLKVDGDQTRHDRAKEALKELEPMMAAENEDHHFDLFTYGEQLSPLASQAVADLDARANAADLTGALEAVKEHYEGKDLGGIIILSDGIDTGAIGRRVQRGEDLDEVTRQFLASFDAPIHTLAAASEEGLRDIAISRVLHDDFAFVHNSITVDVELQIIGMDRQAVPVTLLRDGEILQRKTVQAHPGETLYKISFEFVPNQIGKEVYTIQVPHYDGEALHENNQHHFVLRVIRDRIRVLQVVGRPSWDQRFLREFLKRNPNVELISFFILRTDRNPQLVPQDEMSLIPFPTDELFRNELGSFDLVIFQNFNFGPYNMGRYLQNVADYVNDGGAFAMIGGDLSFASGGYARTPIESLLPVNLPTSASHHQLVDSQHFRPQLTDAGNRHPITQLAFDPAHNLKLWEELPPLQGTNIVLGPTDDAVVLATHPTLQHRGEPMPVITVAERGQGRVMALTSDSTWRWGFEHVGQGGTPREYQSFWNSAIRWLIQDPELKLLRLDVNDDIVAPDQPVDASVRVFAPDYSPAPQSAGQLFLQYTPLENIAQGTALASRPLEALPFETNHSGEWHLDHRFEAPGIYQLRAEVDSATGGALMDENLLLVVPDHAQFRDIVPRNQLLELIADATGGYHTLLPEFSPRRLRFEPPRFVEIHRREVVQLWDNAFLFIFILTVLATEWTLRRRWGRL